MFGPTYPLFSVAVSKTPNALQKLSFPLVMQNEVNVKLLSQHGRVRSPLTAANATLASRPLSGYGGALAADASGKLYVEIGSCTTVDIFDTLHGNAPLLRVPLVALNGGAEGIAVH